MLKNLHSIWEKHELKKVYLFGSYARNEQKPTSDIDFLIEPDIDFSLFDLIKLQLDLEKELKINVDLISNNSISKFLKDSINRDKILIYSQNEELDNSFIEQNRF
jgi:predicted nucleotidyltransferase